VYKATTNLKTGKALTVGGVTIAKDTVLASGTAAHAIILKSRTLMSLISKRWVIPCDGSGNALDPYRRRGPIASKPQPTYLSPAVAKTVSTS